MRNSQVFPRTNNVEEILRVRGGKPQRALERSGTTHKHWGAGERCGKRPEKTCGWTGAAGRWAAAPRRGGRLRRRNN